MTRFSRAKDMVIDRLDEIVPDLFARRVKRARGWHVVSPGSGSKHADQMMIWKNGAWRDFVGGEQGDAIDLIAYALFGGKDRDARMRAIDWIEDRFGLRAMDPATRAEAERTARLRREQREAEDARQAIKHRTSARKMFHAAEETIRNTVAETYLREVRGIDLDALQNVVWASFRFLPRAQFWTVRHKPLFPALVTKMVDAEGQGRACHLTFLEPDGSGKLDTKKRGFVDADGDPLKAKLMWPATSGLCVRLSDGETGLSAEDAAAAGKASILATCEGIEDGFSIALTRPNLRVWPAGSLPNLLTLPLHECASGFLVFQDNDWGKPQPQALFKRAAQRIRSTGKPTEIVAMPPAWGKDVNDAINFEGEE